MKTVLRLSTKAAICSSISQLQKAVKLLQAMKTTKNKKIKNGERRTRKGR